MSYGFGVMIEGIVAILLAVTIGYCYTLNARLKQLKADEQTMKSTIVELVAATATAERAVAGLKATVRECDNTLGERLRNAELVTGELNRQMRGGEMLLQRVSRIVNAARPEGSAEAPVLQDPKAMVAAAHALAERTRMRASGLGI